MASIKDLKPCEHTLVLTHPSTNELIPEATMTIVGKYSREFYDAAKDVLRNKEAFNNDFEITETENRKTLAACVRGWNEEYFDGECTFDNVLALITDPELGFVYDQLEQGVMARANFFRTEGAVDA